MSDTETNSQAPARDSRGRLLPGNTANPHGREKGSRAKFGEQFVREFADHWYKNGLRVLDKLAADHHEAYARVACTLLPKVIEFDEETRDVLEKVAAAAQLPFHAIREKAQVKDKRPKTR
jgi:hypothetical protein